MKILILLLLFVISAKTQDLDCDAFSTPVIEKEESTKQDDQTEHSQVFSTFQNKSQVSTSENPDEGISKVIFQNQDEDIFNETFGSLSTFNKSSGLSSTFNESIFAELLRDFILVQRQGIFLQK
jgi:hypothetical protein